MTRTSEHVLSLAASDPALAQLCDEIIERLQSGEGVDVASLALQHPEYAEQLQRLIPAFEALVDLGATAARQPVQAIANHGMAEPAPRVLGDYCIVREIGRGGMGVVYEAEQRSLNRRVALKVLPMAAALDARQFQRFQLEAQAAACLHHNNIVPVFAVGTEGGVPFYAMQYIEGRSLAEVIDELRRAEGLNEEPPPHVREAGPRLADLSTTALARSLVSGQAPTRHADGPTEPHGTVPPGEAQDQVAAEHKSSKTASSTRTRDYCRNVARLGLQAAEALDHAHTRGILHRDIKPANLLLDAEGRLWVTDFGLAQIQGNHGLTLSGDILGTLRYMSPEQALARRVVIDGRTDVYSLGVTLYELLTLQPAFDGKDRTEILRRIESDEPTSLRKLNASVPQDLETIVLKAMAKEAAGRYATAQELAGDLRNCLEDRPIRARRPGLLDRAAKWSRRHRAAAWSAATTALVAALMLAGGIGYMARDRAVRLAQTRQRVAEALAGARTAIEAGDLTLAGQNVAEAQGRLGSERERLPDVAADTDRIRHEIEARQADAARFAQFLKGARDAQDQRDNGLIFSESGDRVAERTLGLYGVLTEKDWLSRLDRSYLTADQKQQVRGTAYATLVSLADYHIRWGWRRGEPKSVERSLDLLQRAEEFHQPTRAFYFVRAECRRRQGDTAAADEDVKRFKAAEAQTAWDYYLPGHTAGWNGDLDEAIRSYKAALRLQPDHYNSLFFLGLRLFPDKNRWQEAIAYLTASIALRPDAANALRNRAECYNEHGQRDEAIEDCRHGIRLNPGNANVLVELGLLLGRLEKRDEAIAALRQAVSIEPDDPRYRIHLGNLLSAKGEVGEATASYFKAIEIWDASPDLSPGARDNNDVAWCLVWHAARVGSHDPDQAGQLARKGVELARRAVELDPKNGGHWNTLGVALYRAGDWKAAIEALGKSEQLAANEHTAFNGFFLAMAHWQLGRVGEARAWYDKAVAWMEKNGPKDKELLRFRAEAAALLGLSDMPDDAFARP
jgi:serine/threonine protein kinase/Flp pilus assembly protein TadD